MNVQGNSANWKLPLQIRIAVRLVVLILFAVFAVGQTIDQDRINVMVEALSRLDPDQVSANPKLKEALNKVLEATRGTPKFAELIRKFKIKDQSPALLELTLANPNETAGIDALRLILESKDFEILKKSLTGTNILLAIKLAEALGNVGENQITPLLEPLIADPKRDSALRKQAVRGLTRTQEGASLVLRLAKEDKLGADIKLVASTELSQVRWPNIQAEAAKVLPRPQTKNSEPLPSIAELVRMKADGAHGAEVFARPDVGCMNCHQVNGKGNDFGPKLSEIGTKLAKEALFEAILDPSAGISFGYEAWQIELKSGDEAYGLIVSETNDEISIKSQNGIVARYRKKDIAKRDKQRTSIMPAGLQQTMSVQDLVDLVEYLTTLKKSPN